ncbi:dipeptide epimerase [Jiulongibacter sp. NS-SX5]|uniref:dipeptide epimerase n=1 Tax=Jiulongibacter sp. NS-SX5 TaxID=3463854 RepID=UPI004059B964
MSGFLLPFQLQNRNAFRIAHGSRTETSTLLVQLEKNGVTGLGEAAHVPYYGVSVEQSIKDIKGAWSEIEPFIGKPSNEFWSVANKELGQNHFAICALDIAHHDLLAKTERKSLSQALNIDISKTPKSSFTIGIGSAEEMLESIAKTDFPILKIKLGSEDDFELLKQIRGGTEKPLRLDINGGWDLRTTFKMLDLIHELGGIEFLEQPLAKTIIDENGEIRSKCNIPLMADEVCMREEDVIKVAPYFDGINIKLSKCGGITPALRMIRQARELDLKIMLGCMTESSAGISAMAHLAALVDYVDMDGANMIKNDPVEGVVIDNGTAIFNERLGHGGELKEDIDTSGIITL